MIRTNADESDPVRSPDPIAFISVFAAVLYGLVPKDVAQRFEDEICKVVCEFTKITKGADWQSLTGSHKRCVESISLSFWELYLRHGLELPSSIPLCIVFSSLHPKTYSHSWPILPDSLPTFIRLIQGNPTSAAFSLLTMYSIRHRTLIDYPDSFDDLFMKPFESEGNTHDIGKFTIPSPSPLQLIDGHRRPISIKPTHCDEVPHPFDLGRTGRRVG